VNHKTDQVSGAFSCTLNPEPVNYAQVAAAAALAMPGGPKFVFLSGAINYLSQSWICRF